MGSFIKIARKNAGLTQEEASKLSGIALGTIRRWEQGVNEPDMGSIVLLSKLYNTSTDFMLTGLTSDDELKKDAESVEYANVPLFGSVAAGKPIGMMRVDNTFPIPSALRDKYPHSFLLKVEGTSMDRIIPDGCYALVDPCDSVDHDGAPYAVCVNGYDATIKRVRRLANGFELVPDSTDPTYKPVVFDYGVEGTETVTVIGRVVYYVLPYDWSF